MVRSKAVWSSAVLVMVMSMANAAGAETRETASRPVVRPGVVGTRSVVVAQAQHQDRSKVLPVLFGTYAVLQVLDVKSTVAAVRNGAVEKNPIVGSMAGSTGQFLALKAVSTAVTFAAVKAMEKRSKTAAVITMVALNGVTAAVVANNTKNARR